MTESEAKTKWCPMTASKEYNRSNLSQNCIASQCMAWRQTEGPDPNSYGYDAEGNTVQSKESSGFCGMAGRP